MIQPESILLAFKQGSKTKRPRIFLVDDDPDISLTFKVGLEEHGFLVDVFNDPIVALSNFKTGTYDLLLIDIKMPKMNGFELYIEIEKIDSKVKVCFITAFVVYYESLREIFPKTKVSCFIKKPIDISILADRLRAELRDNSPFIK
jgi:two-component system, OmpR family, response regulator ChvI